MWKFKKIEPGTPERNPHEAEFFRLTNPAEAVIREFIQNALDDRASNEAVVTVRIFLGRVSCRDVAQFFDGLYPHLSACGITHLESSDEISYLAIEDAGTTGLDGETKWPSDSNFSKFWHGEGTSLKGGLKAGRWGLGKTTFHLASKIKTFWGFTLRIDDRRALLMGKALLKTHKTGNDVYNYAGYYVRDGWEPVNDTRIINLFKTNFRLHRNTEPGLSIVIPFLDDEITYDNVLHAAAKHYFYAMLTGMLKVEIEESTRRITLDKDNLVSAALSLGWDSTEWGGVDLSEMISFVNCSIGNANPVELTIADLSNPEITSASLSNLEELKDRFRQGRDCHFKVPVTIKDSGGSELRSFYTVHLKRTPRLDKALEFYVRSGVLVSEIKTLGNKPVIALLTAQDEPVTKFLGDCETPAHTDWNERTEGFKDKYENAARTLRFIKRSTGRIVSMLDEPPRERQIDFLKEIFAIAVRPEEREEGEDTSSRSETLKTERSEPLFNISRVSGGFTVTLNPKRTNVSFPIHAVVRTAYATRRGNAFSQYEPLDFDLGSGNMVATLQNCNIVSRKPNELEIKITGNSFSLRFRGFDTNRDLVVDVKEKMV